MIQVSSENNQLKIVTNGTIEYFDFTDIKSINRYIIGGHYVLINFYPDISNDFNKDSIKINIALVDNQAGWTVNVVGVDQAVTDISSWKADAIAGSIFDATDVEGTGFTTDGQVLIWSQTNGQFEAGTISSANIYNSDDNLTSNRTVTMSSGVTPYNLFFYDASSMRYVLSLSDNNVGVNTFSPTALLDVFADGALQTDLIIRVRNSANTLDLFKVQGNGSVYIDGSSFHFNGASNTLEMPNAGLNTSTITLTTTAGIASSGGVGDTRLYSKQAPLTDGFSFGTYYARMSVGAQTTTGWGTTASNLIGIENGTAPSSNVTDMCVIYSSDESAGNACFTTRSENGRVSKLFQYVDSAFGNTVNTGDANTDALINAIISAMTAQGTIATV